MPKFLDPFNFGKKNSHDVTIYGSVLTLTGGSGTANITICGFVNTVIATYAGASLTTTATNWVADNYEYYRVRGFLVSNVAQVITVVPAHEWDSVNRVNVSIANVSTNLSGTLTGKLEVDFAKGRNWRVTFGQNITILAPRNARDGDPIRLELKATGAYSITWTAGTYYFAGGTETSQTSTSTDIYKGVFNLNAARRFDTLTLSGSTTDGHSGTIYMPGTGIAAQTVTVSGSSLTTTAGAFKTANEAAYLAAGVVLTSSGATLIFTASSAKSDYYGQPQFTNVSGTLAGANVQTKAGRVEIDTVYADVKQ